MSALRWSVVPSGVAAFPSVVFSILLIRPYRRLTTIAALLLAPCSAATLLLLRAVDQAALIRYTGTVLNIVAKSVGDGREHREGFCVGTFHRWVSATPCERNRERLSSNHRPSAPR
ncbi:MAG: hypothetical protein JSS46_08565 [Proteobacteria bacterium]|nr:hypothetical protein [Pseudomonadota bacterium]